MPSFFVQHLPCHTAAGGCVLLWRTPQPAAAAFHRSALHPSRQSGSAGPPALITSECNAMWTATATQHDGPNHLGLWCKSGPGCDLQALSNEQLLAPLKGSPLKPEMLLAAFTFAKKNLHPGSNPAMPPNIPDMVVPRDPKSTCFRTSLGVFV